MIDLHTHTVCSDGTLTPTELLAAADRLGLRAISITDHDLLDAYADLPARTGGAELIIGVELSLSWPRGNLHLLGYHVDPGHAGLRDTLERLRAARVERNEEMVARMNAAGLPVTMARLTALAGRTHIGRPHMAQALVELGVVRGIPEAFEKYLADDCALYVPRRDLAPAEAIELVHAAGGAAVLAHPAQTRLSPLDLNDAVASWVRLGLDGLEVYYPQHTPRQRRGYRELAQRHRLVITAGSDFHGATKPGVQLGVIPGALPGDDELLTALAAAAARWR